MDAHLTGAVAPGLAAPMSAENACPVGAASVAPAAEPHLRLIAQKVSAPVANTTQSRERNVHRDFADDGATGKARATLTARFALRGYSLHQLPGDTYLVTRRNLSRSCVDLHAARRFPAQIEGTR